MTSYGGRELAAAFRTVRDNTLKIADEIPENQYDFRATPDTRSVGQMLVHIALGPSFQHHVHSNKIADMTTINFPELFQRIGAEEAKPRDQGATVTLLKTEGDKFASFLESLPDSFLADTVAMPPGMGPATKTRFEMLLSAKEHEMHHRGQLMLIQRMLGLVPHLTRKMQERMASMQAGQGATR
jgi:uncharacterized damage-inducible protein DinB